jgi:predicted protein tyrosine phosphatase
MSSYNRLHNVNNPNQGRSKKVLCICSAGLLRSPTIAWVLSNAPYNFNTRAAGAVEEYALVPVDEVLLQWADVVVFADKDHKRMVEWKHEGLLDTIEHHVLDIPDIHKFRAPQLVTIIEEKVKEIFPTT